ncbi:TniQ family protein [Aliiroseovarius sp. S2029]|uniref:TniQ family protein n=1 Tax=Aliiroseovarius sp. S2029 TaxID=2936988 RepID=UPI0020C110E1|nr:TniQ family protein [Aliiroseovarius sp. S2029]MCK8484198.1 TniQ family protein [Aliiroseovarius sp. S2029]
MNAPLVLALPLIEGETPYGYVSRNAQRHHTTPRDFCTDMGMRWPFLCSAHPDQLDRLSWITGAPLETLTRWSAPKSDIGRYRVGQAFSTTGAFRRTATRLCPRCVVSALEARGPAGVVQMLEWSVLALYRCPTHGCALMTLPPAKNSHATYDFAGQVLRHAELLRRARCRATPIAGTRYEAYVRRRIWEGPQDDWLRTWDLTHIHRASLTLGAGLNAEVSASLQHMPAAEQTALCDAGFEALSGGRDAYRNALEKLRTQSRSERPYFSADMGPFYHWLREVYADEALHQLTDVTRQHVFATYPTPMDKEVFGKKPDKEIWLTMEDARKRSGFGAVFLKRLLGHMQGVPEGAALKRTDVHLDEVAQARAYWNSLINLKDAAGLLGILTQQVKALQNRDVLSTVRITSSLRYLLRDEVRALLAQLDALPEWLPGKSVVPLKEFCRAKGVPLAQVIDLWAQGDLDGKLCRGDGAGLQAMEVDWDALCGKSLLQLDRDLMLPETASYLKIGLGSIRHLRDHGYLCQVQRRNPDTNHRKNYISRASIAGFEATYVTLGQLAALGNIAPIHLARRLDRELVRPLSCGGKLVRVYKRGDVLPGEQGPQMQHHHKEREDA